MFGPRYFGHRHYGPRYFGDGADTAPPTPSYTFRPRAARFAGTLFSILLVLTLAGCA